MGFMTKVVRFPWQSTINLAMETAAQVEAYAAVRTWRMADTLREVVKEGLKELVRHLDQEDKKRFEDLKKVILEQKDLRKKIAGGK